MSTHEDTGDQSLTDGSFIDELINRMAGLETKYRDQFNQNPLSKNIYDIVSDQTKGEQVNPIVLCAIFTDFAEAFLEKASDTTQTMQQSDKLSKELYKANDLIRRLTDENEYHLSKLKNLGKQLEVYKESWRGKLTEQSVERQISDLLKQKDEEVEDLKVQLTSVEQDFAQYRMESKSLGGNHNFDSTPAKVLVKDENQSSQFSDLKGNDPKKYRLPKSMNFDELYNEISSLSQKDLIDHCIDLKSKLFLSQPKTKERAKSRSNSGVRSSHPCTVHKTLQKTLDDTENLEKRYKRFRKLAEELTIKNEVYQKDIVKAENKIAHLETEFNQLVENFQDFINQKNDEIAQKESEISEIRRSKETKSEPEEEEADFQGLDFDPEERAKSIEVYEKILDQYPQPHERDEALLEMIKQYIYEKQPNIAYGIWEAADFSHCNNVEKTYKLMKALLQD